MIDVYVLKNQLSGAILCIATDFERCSMAEADEPANVQKFLKIENHSLLEDGD